MKGGFVNNFFTSLVGEEVKSDVKRPAYIFFQKMID
jgi:hypothetical protein